MDHPTAPELGTWTPDGETPVRPSEDALIAACATVYDPEIPVNIYELGLIYAIDIADDGQVKVEMTLTAPGCPSAQELPEQVREACMAVHGVCACDVEVVWDPPWDPSRMTEESPPGLEHVLSDDKVDAMSTTIAQAKPRRPLPPLMALTDAAAERLRGLYEKGQQGMLLRIGVNTKGCSGLAYDMTWVEAAGPGDEVVTDKGVTVLVDRKASLFLIGTTMDYEVKSLSSGFSFTNPNEKGRCGCGESFHV